MSKAVLAIDRDKKRKGERFSAKEFARIMRVATQHRGPLALGLLATIVYACLHTVSLTVALPVFKVLLEDEGVHGWVYRELAGRRLSVQFAVPNDEGVAALTKVGSDSPLFAAGLRAADRVRGAGEVALLKAVALAEGEIEIVPVTGEHAGARIAVAPEPLGFPYALAKPALSLLPASASTDKLATLKGLMVALLIVVVLANVFRYLGEVMIAKSVLLAMLDLRSTLYERTLALPMSFFAGQTTSDLVGRFVQDVQEVQRGLMALFSRFIREPLRAAFILGFAFFLDWRITAALVVATPIGVAIFWRIGKRVKRSNRKLLEAFGQMIDALSQSLQNLRVVKTYTAEEHERRRLRAVDERVLKQQLRLAKLQAMVSPLMETVGISCACVLIIWLASQVVGNQLSISRFATLCLTLSVLFDPLRKLTDLYVRVIRASAGSERVFQVIDQPAESELDAGTREAGPLVERIELKGVTFTYPGSETPALSDLNLTIEKGETLAIVGPNGSGKTTMVSLLPRLFVPESGEILYDGTDIREFSLGSLRRQVGLVTQEAVVFAGTPEENITYGLRHPNGRAPAGSGSGDGEVGGIRERVKKAASRAFAEEFIQALPGGYDGQIGERGSTLSGGQRQRLAIARAIFRDAPILVFDEATSQVDSESESKIRRALEDFSTDRTTIIIAHRLSTIQFATRIAVLSGGRLIDVGKHGELYDRCELYRALCDTQQ